MTGPQQPQDNDHDSDSDQNNDPYRGWSQQRRHQARRRREAAGSDVPPGLKRRLESQLKRRRIPTQAEQAASEERHKKSMRQRYDQARVQQGRPPTRRVKPKEELQAASDARMESLYARFPHLRPVDPAGLPQMQGPPQGPSSMPPPQGSSSMQYSGFSRGPTPGPGFSRAPTPGPGFSRAPTPSVDDLFGSGSTPQYSRGITPGLDEQEWDYWAGNKFSGGGTSTQPAVAEDMPAYDPTWGGYLSQPDPTKEDRIKLAEQQARSKQREREARDRGDQGNSR